MLYLCGVTGCIVVRWTLALTPLSRLRAGRDDVNYTRRYFADELINKMTLILLVTHQERRRVKVTLFPRRKYLLRNLSLTPDHISISQVLFVRQRNLVSRIYLLPSSPGAPHPEDNFQSPTNVWKRAIYRYSYVRTLSGDLHFLPIRFIPRITVTRFLLRSQEHFGQIIYISLHPDRGNCCLQLGCNVRASRTQ